MTWTEQTKNSSTWTELSQSLTDTSAPWAETAPWAMTEPWGEVLVGPTWTNQIKN